MKKHSRGHSEKPAAMLQIVVLGLGLMNVTDGAGAGISAEAIASPSQPIPLPDPKVFQGAQLPARTDSVTIVLPPGGKTEVKAVMPADNVILYTWKTDKGVVYVDFHGHSPDWTNKKAFVRYLEAQEAAADSGSLVAPFAGEHGWFWENKQSEAVTITLTVNGYHEAIKKYGL